MTARFFALTFIATWICWGAAFTIEGAAQSALILTGVFMPAIVALALSGRAASDLLARVIAFGASPWLYVFAIAYMPSVKLAAAALHRALFGALPRFGSESLVLMIIATFISTWTQAGEEIGWRGFALPRLAARFGWPAASVILGVIWAFWHLPLFFLPGSTTYKQPMVLYVLQVTAASVAIAWLYKRSGGSLLLAMLMHAAINNFKQIVPSIDAPAIAWLTATVMWVLAAPLLVALAHDARPSRAAAGSEAPRNVAT